MTEKIYLYYFFKFKFIFGEWTLEVLCTSAEKFMTVVYSFKYSTAFHNYMDFNNFKNKNSNRLGFTYFDWQLCFQNKKLSKLLYFFYSFFHLVLVGFFFESSSPQGECQHKENTHVVS